MPTRKQRRRRQKDLRHEYEYVYVDEEGQEVEVDAGEQPKARRNGKATAKSRNGKPVREVQPPSWSRVVKRVALIAPLLFLAFSALNHHQSLAQRIVITLVYTAVFAPMMYLMDRALYRSYLKRTGQPVPPPFGRKR